MIRIVPVCPSSGEMWRLEDENEADVAPGAGDPRPRSQSPFSHFRRRAAYLRKSISADDHLGEAEFEPTQPEGRSFADPKVKLKRKFVSSSVSKLSFFEETVHLEMSIRHYLLNFMLFKISLWLFISMEL